MQTDHVVQISTITRSSGETRRVARDLASRIDVPAVIALVGQLGSGKTEFVKGLGWAMGLDPDRICSATFVIAAEYGGQRRLTHVDAYRLGGADELDTIGWDELLSENSGIIAVEWADRVRHRLPSGTLWTHLHVIGSTERKIAFRTHTSSPWKTVIESMSLESQP